MAKVVTSWAELESALQDEMYDAMEETINNSFENLHEYVDHFYSAPEGTYHRTGQLAESPEQELSGKGNVITGEIKLDTSYVYSPSGRDTETIYGYAENDGLLGYGGFWKNTEIAIEENLENAFSKRFK